LTSSSQFITADDIHHHSIATPRAIAGHCAIDRRQIPVHHLCRLSAIAPIIVVITAMSAPKHDIDLAHAGPSAIAKTAMTAAEIIEYFIVALLVEEAVS
jgi:hypothetical protein